MKRLIIVTMTLLTTSSAVLSAHKGSETTIKLIATSDVHGAFFAYDFLAKQPAKGSSPKVGKTNISEWNTILPMVG